MKVESICVFPFFALVVGACQLTAATVCVNPSGGGGCFKKINEGVTAANANDTVQVAAGTYKEDVLIAKSIYLIGAGAGLVFIDASGLANGIYIDGRDHAGLSDVVVRGFTVENAKLEGILITNSSGVTISGNHVINNNKSLVVTSSSASCPDLASFEPNAEQTDCGEGIHLSAVDHSIVSKNLVTGNSGGILITDDTGATHDNLISYNTVQDNPYACGITLASHSPAGSLGMTPIGVYHNTVFQNVATHDGAAAGGGAGVGLFTPAPGTATYGNVIVSNTLMDNGLPGVAMHSHAPGQDLNDNMIIGNTLSGNGPDSDDASGPTPPAGINVFGITPITGTIIAHNVISDETADISVNTGSEVSLHLNNLLGGEVGVDNIGSGTVNATDNYWGCAAGPTSAACSNVGGPGLLSTAWMTNPF